MNPTSIYSMYSMQHSDQPETSSKKYPNNKYYQFKDEDSSGRKYIKQLYSDKNGKPTADYNKENNQKSHNCSPTEHMRSNWASQYEKYYEPIEHKYLGHLPNRDRTAITQAGHTQKPKKSSTRKSKRVLSQSMCSHHQKKPSKQSLAKQQQQELKHYKKICLQMRKKNARLSQELDDCQAQNKASIRELQEKVDKIAGKFAASSDAHKTDRILESLKSINGKLGSKKTLNKSVRSDKSSKYQKFYTFFVESLGIFEPKPALSANLDVNILETKMIWKEMIQFLITHDYKIQHQKNTNQDKSAPSFNQL